MFVGSMDKPAWPLGAMVVRRGDRLCPRSQSAEKAVARCGPDIKPSPSSSSAPDQHHGLDTAPRGAEDVQPPSEASHSNGVLQGLGQHHGQRPGSGCPCPCGSSWPLGICGVSNDPAQLSSGGLPHPDSKGPSTPDVRGQEGAAALSLIYRGLLRSLSEGHWLRPGALLSVISNMRSKARRSPCCQRPRLPTAPENWDHHCRGHLSLFPPQPEKGQLPASFS